MITLTNDEVGGYLPLAPGVSSVRYPIRQRTFKYVATVQSVTDETCQEPSLASAARRRARRLIAPDTMCWIKSRRPIGENRVDATAM
jgi:hypothetical protein